MQFININLKGLNGRPHPCLRHIYTARDAVKARCHVKFLCCDVYTLEKKAKFQGGDPKCRLCCSKDSEKIVHIVSICEAYSELRMRILNEIKIACESSLPRFEIDDLLQDNFLKTQFILDCSSFNLPLRINADSDLYVTVLKLSRDFCYGISKLRTEKLKFMQQSIEE